MRKKLLAVSIATAFVSAAPVAQVKVAITSPKDGPAVERPIIEGTVSDPNAAVWVVVHPLGDSNYWVQPRISVRQNSSWRAQIYIGRPGRIDVGKIFEVRAVANPRNPLREGLMLDQWPEAAAISELTEVTRK